MLAINDSFMHFYHATFFLNVVRNAKNIFVFLKKSKERIFQQVHNQDYRRSGKRRKEVF
jgi:hypothetical protein